MTSPKVSELGSEDLAQIKVCASAVAIPRVASRARSRLAGGLQGPILSATHYIEAKGVVPGE